MINKIKEFINSEQVLNNYSLYGNNAEAFFRMSIEIEYLPESQNWFKLPFFLVPIDADFSASLDEENVFLNNNLYFIKNDKKFYPFFVHPTTANIFCMWLKNKYEFVSADNSIFFATPTSSYRTLLVKNLNTNLMFFAKVTLFKNVANGSRHIDWESSYYHQYQSSNIVNKNYQNDRLIFFKDIATFGITGDKDFLLSDNFKIQFGSKKIRTFGTIIRKIPDSFYELNDKRICSFASYTSLINRKSYLERGVENSNLNSELFIRKYIYEPLKKIILDLLFNHGIMLEFHSQNVLLEYDNNYIPTGVFFYRDFDMTSYDRARFPFIHFEEWKEILCNHEDFISVESNIGNREGIAFGIFIHFLDNLIMACLRSLYFAGKFSSDDVLQIRNAICNELYLDLLSKYPLIVDLFKNDKKLDIKLFDNIHCKEIPVELKRSDLPDDNLFCILLNKKIIDKNGIVNYEGKHFYIECVKDIITKIILKEE